MDGPKVANWAVQNYQSVLSKSRKVDGPKIRKLDGPKVSKWTVQKSLTKVLNPFEYSQSRRSRAKAANLRVILDGLWTKANDL